MRIRKQFHLPKGSTTISEYAQEWYRQDNIQYLATRGTFINYGIYTKADTYEDVVYFDFDISEEHATFYFLKFGN